jgi:hypothetical protein
MTPQSSKMILLERYFVYLVIYKTESIEIH